MCNKNPFTPVRGDTCQVVVKERVGNGTPNSILWITYGRDLVGDLSIPGRLSMVNVVTGGREHHSSVAPNSSPQAGTKHQQGYINHVLFCLKCQYEHNKTETKRREEGQIRVYYILLKCTFAVLFKAWWPGGGAVVS